jgi:MFS family permease
MSEPIAAIDAIPADVRGAGLEDAEGRPTKRLPMGQLIRISLYWLGLSAVWSGFLDIVNGRLQFTGLVPKGSEGTGAFEISIFGAIIAILVQPTVGSISDYTITRWGRRKPYILIGSVADLVFLYGIATSDSVLAIAAFVALLQFSSNFAQGPFQGYVPDLVPAPQVGVASGLIGLFSALGNVTGFAVAALAIRFSATDPNAFFYGTLALGAIEIATMLSVVIRVDEGRRAKLRNGRSWLSIAGEAWGTDVLREHSFLWLVASRFFVLLAGSLLVTLSTFYLAQTFGLSASATGDAKLILLAVVIVGIALAVVPAARLSDRIGRKRVIYGACAIGATGLAIAALAPSVPVAMVGAALFAVAAGSFLAVDWALMTDIIPKASSGRYMGISNVATASSGVVALALGGAGVMDTANKLLGYGTGPRAALWLGVLCYGIGALLLRPVEERRREDPAPELAPEIAASPT